MKNLLDTFLTNFSIVVSRKFKLLLNEKCYFLVWLFFADFLEEIFHGAE